MRSGEENFYVDPVTLETLTLVEAVHKGDEIVSGALLSASGHRFEIKNGVPDLVYPFELPMVDQKALNQYEERADAYDRYLPLYEAKMVHQFDHRFATYDGGDTRAVSPDEHSDPTFVVQGRYWVREEVVESAIPHYPEALALALQLDHRPSIQRVLCWWVAGYHLNHGEGEAAARWLAEAVRHRPQKGVERLFGEGRDREHAAALAADFALSAQDVAAIAQALREPDKLAGELVERFSPF